MPTPARRKVSFEEGAITISDVAGVLDRARRTATRRTRLRRRAKSRTIRRPARSTRMARASLRSVRIRRAHGRNRSRYRAWPVKVLHKTRARRWPRDQPDAGGRPDRRRRGPRPGNGADGGVPSRTRREPARLSHSSDRRHAAGRIHPDRGCLVRGPYGAKGIGEHSMIPTAPAIFNAIHDATGVRVRAHRPLRIACARRSSHWSGREVDMPKPTTASDAMPAL